MDIYGYFTPPASGTLQFYPMNPCRVIDTGNAAFPVGFGPPDLTGGVPAISR